MKSLAYEDIRKELTDFLRAHPSFKDYNFDASGISSLVNALAYNDHRFGYFAKMLLDESFVDSAHSFPAMLSHAKRLGYTASGKKAAVILIEAVVTTPDLNYPASTVLARRGTQFKATNSAADTRIFTCLSDYELAETRRDANGKTFSGPILLHEGTIRNAEFTTDASVTAPTFAVKDPGLDITSIAVYTQGPGGTSWERVRGASTPADVNPDDQVFYTTYDRLGVYTVWFAAPYAHATKVRVEYLSTTGLAGNGAKVVAFVTAASTGQGDINAFATVLTTSDALSQGGSDGQDVEAVRAGIPRAWRRQHRAVTSEDIRGLVTELYQDASAVTVWGGEDEPRRRYGKKMICVVPKTSRVLSLGGREEIRRLLSAYKIPGDDIVFVDATVQLVDIEVVVKRALTAASDDELRRDCLVAVDALMGITSSTAITAFSSYALAAAVKSRVAGVEYAYPTATFFNELNLAKASVVQIDYGNAVHHPVVLASDIGVTATSRALSPSVVEITSSGPGKIVVTATPVVPELKAIRRVYFEVRSRKVKVVK